MIYTKNIWSLLNRNRDRKFYFVRHIETLAGQSLPCVKGGGRDCNAEAKLVIELDGSGHYTEDGKQYDEERTAFLEEYGLMVIRIPNTEIHKNFRGVCEYINQLVEQSLSQLR
ncbi:MAG: DUF559 domain-containing protein [Ruminococcaceae bacterium]|nr:DUF559 domain-containing protein [Oscillospiraceae bacterium]